MPSYRKSAPNKVQVIVGEQGTPNVGDKIIS